MRELESLGLTTETIKDLLEGSKNQSTTNTGIASIEYDFDGTTRAIHPRLSLKIEADGAQLSELSSTTRTALKDLLKRASEHDGESPTIPVYDPVASAALEERIETLQLDDSQTLEKARSGSPDSTKTIDARTIQVHLDSDAEFFDMLSEEVDELDQLQSKEKAVVLSDIDHLGSRVATLVRPNNKGKANANLEAWRKLLRLYEDAGVFKPASEAQRRNHTPEKAAQQLTWYVNEVQKAGILDSSPKGAQSRDLYAAFNALNFAILRQIKFQSMNQQAMDKILKKFDKRTSLGAKHTFPTFMAADPFFANGLASAMHYALASNLLSVVPQLDDYECPVCTSITVKPVRLSCSHVFCVRCLIRLQLAKENHCPICRRSNVLAADSTNIDYALLNFLKMYFPREAKAKQRANEKEQLKQSAEAAGMESGSCVIM